MSISSSEAFFDNSAEMNKTETQWGALSSQFTPALTRLIAAYLNDTDLEKFDKATLNSNTFFPYGVCQEDIARRRYVKEKILPHVFRVGPDSLKEILKQESSKPGLSMFTPQILLIKAGFNEGYNSAVLQKFICFRQWEGVSAVTASAYVGDIFHLIRILGLLLKADEGKSYANEEDSFRFQAMRQLEEVQSRITEQTIHELNLLLNVVNAIVTMEFGKDVIFKAAAKLRLEKLLQSEVIQFLIGDQSIVKEATASGFTQSKGIINSFTFIQNDVPDQKILTEEKLIAEEALTTFSEESGFLTPLLRLLKASINYLVQHPKLNGSKNYDELNTLWEIVGECQKRLFHNILQEYFDPDKPFSMNTPVDFNREPNRGLCMYSGGGPLNLDNIGLGTLCGIFKSNADIHALSGCWDPMYHAVAGSLGAITPYFKLRTTALGNIIRALKKSDVTEADLFEACADNGKLVGNYIS